MLEYVLFFGLFIAAILFFVMDQRREEVAEVPAWIAERNKTESPIEVLLFDLLNANGYVVKTQVKIGPYRADFVLPQHRLVIEADGKQYHQDRKAYDRRRDAYMRKLGWKVVRFSGRQIYRDRAAILRRIEKVISS